MRDHRMRFGFVPSDPLRSRASFIAFSFRPSREPRKHRLSSLCAAQRSLYSAETTPKQQRKEFPLGSQAIGLCSGSMVPKPPNRGTQTFHLCGSNPAKITESLIYLLRVFASKNRAELLGQNEPREEE